MKRQMRKAFQADAKRRKNARRGPSMLAKQKWQAKTIRVLEMVFEERVRQFEKHADAMKDLPDGTGPDTTWLSPLGGEWILDAETIQKVLRDEYEKATDEERLTRMHLVLEEVAEAFETDGDSPDFIMEILQVAALCVQWVEIKMDDPRKTI